MRTVLLPYKVLATLAWGDLGCLARGSDGWISGSTSELTDLLGLRRTPRLKYCLEYLEALGLVQHLRWHRGWFSLTLTPTQGVTRGPAPDPS